MDINDKKVTSDTVTGTPVTSGPSSGTSNFSAASTHGTVINLDKSKSFTKIVQEIDDGTEALLITYDKDKGQIDVYHNGEKINTSVFDSQLNGLSSFYELVKNVLDKCRKWSTAWMPSN